MRAHIDCVAITDHNSGAWIDKLKSAYRAMEGQHRASPIEGFRELTLFPGVEISVQGGFHLLAIFDPSTSGSDIDSLLGRVGYKGTKGASDRVTRRGAAEVVAAVRELGGIPIPAHADGPKGLLRTGAGGQGTVELDANTIRQVLDEPGIVAMEVTDRNWSAPVVYQERRVSWSSVLGSDCHSLQGGHGPGSGFTWVKMAAPSLDGLRLALIDGKDISVRRSDEGEFAPFELPDHFITRLEVVAARFMGNGAAETIELSPFCNALVGGRGVGKSTVVQALRLASRRENEVVRLGEESEPHRQFRRFAQVVAGRRGDGALRKETEIRVELMRNGITHRLRWRQDGEGPVVEVRQAREDWQPSPSQAVTSERFPIRVLSQGQIAAMAGESRGVLLGFIDEAAGLQALREKFDNAKRAYFARQARLRELRARLDKMPETQRRLDEVKRKLEAFARSRHAEVLASQDRAQRQRREMDRNLEFLEAVPERVRELSSDLLLDDWQLDAFNDQADADVLSWRAVADQALTDLRRRLEDAATGFSGVQQTLAGDIWLDDWRNRIQAAHSAYEALQQSLRAQGVDDAQEFGALTQSRKLLEEEVETLQRLHDKVERLQADVEALLGQVVDGRSAITKKRSDFLKKELKANDFVKIEVVPFGYDAKAVELELRDLLDINDERFERDILLVEGSDPISSTGLAARLAEGDGDAVASAKDELINVSERFSTKFRSHLQRKYDATPELVDRVACWFPDDDLRIEYSRGDGDWARIEEASQGQRSAALLAFLLAFGEEPLVLDQPEDDLDNHLIYDLIVRQIRENKQRRQLIVVTHNPNVVVNGDAEMIHAMGFTGGQCRVVQRGALQQPEVRDEICRVMEGGREAFARRWARLGRE
ncbi:MAG: AAA family ATPase [Gammaproteobacteria bacterium]|nr:AAA family ATPase [Gammaproteobacteria bacterium]